MSGNVGGQDGNQLNIYNLPLGKKYDLKQLDKLVGQSTEGSVWAAYDSAASGGNGNSIFDAEEVARIKTFVQENNLVEESTPQTRQAVQDTPSPTEVTAYTVQPGDTPLVIAKKLGFTGAEAEAYAKKLNSHLSARNQLDRRGWLKVGQKIEILGNFKDKISELDDYSEDMSVLQERWANTEAGQRAIQAAEAAKRRTEPGKTKTKPTVAKDTTPYAQRLTISSIRHNGKVAANALKEQIEDASLNSRTRSLLGAKVTNRHVAYILEAYPDLVKDIDDEWGMDIKDIKKYIIAPLNSRLRELGMNKHCIPNDLSKFSIQKVQEYCNNIAKLIRDTDQANGYVFKPKAGDEGKIHKPRRAEQLGSYAPVPPKPKAKPKTSSTTTTSQSGISREEAAQIERSRMLLPEEWSYPTGLQDHIIMLRKQGLQFEIVKIRDGYRMEFNENFQTLKNSAVFYNLTNPALNQYSPTNLLNPLGLKDKTSLIFDKDGNLIQERQEQKFGITTTTDYIDGKPQAPVRTFRATVNYSQIDSQRGVTDNIPTKISIQRPEHLEDNDNAQEFANALENNKASLMNVLGISNETYDGLATLSMAIAEQETHFGESLYTTQAGKTQVQKKVIAKKVMDWFYYDCSQTQFTFMKRALGLPDSLSKDDVFKLGGNISEQISKYHRKFTDGTKSFGVTQVKVDEFIKDNPTLKKQFAKFGINSGVDIRTNPEKQAIATMIILNNKRLVAQSPVWQERLQSNNAHIQRQEDKITENDLIALLYNGNSKVLNRFKTTNDIVRISDKGENRGLSYARNVRAYKKGYYTLEVNAASRNRADALGAQSQGNNGRLGTVIFMPSAYTTNVTNSQNDVKTLENALNKNTSIPAELKQQLINAVKKNEIAFGYGLTAEEAASITKKDAELILKNLQTLKSRISNIVDPTRIRTEAQRVQDDFRSSYLQSRQVVVNDHDVASGSIIPALSSGDIVNERLVSSRNTIVRGHEAAFRDGARRSRVTSANGQYYGFGVEADKGVNPYDANGNYIPQRQRILAEYASDVARDMNVGGRCMTGVKATFESAGIVSRDKVTYPHNITHKVREGDTPLSIAKSLGYSGSGAERFAEKLTERLKNQAVIDSDNKLIPGKNIDVKNAQGKSVKYTIKAGDTIESIVTGLGYTGEAATRYVNSLKSSLGALTVFDASGKLLAGKKIIAIQAGTSIEVAKDLRRYLAAHPEKFEEVKYVSLGNGTSRELNASDIRNLPAGYIGVFIPGPGYENQAGHAFITNGNGQGYADEVDNLRWDDFKSGGAGNGKGEHGTFKIYRLKV